MTKPPAADTTAKNLPRSRRLRFDRHEWAGKEPDTVYLSRDAVERLLDGLEIVALDEVEEDGNSFIGPTHWHVWDVIARRPG